MAHLPEQRRMDACWVKNLRLIQLIIFSLVFSACKAVPGTPVDTVNQVVPEAVVVENSTDTPLSLQAHVVAVDVSGNPGSYQFSVEIESADTGCDQYADWWEVLTTDGKLLYRRILTHSHVEEQPFARSGGPVDVMESTEVIIRAHMHPYGYGGTAYKGTARDGFEPIQLPANFADGLKHAPPQPSGCAF